jgi:hypothetical protein
MHVETIKVDMAKVRQVEHDIDLDALVNRGNTVEDLQTDLAQFCPECEDRTACAQANAGREYTYCWLKS